MNNIEQVYNVEKILKRFLSVPSDVNRELYIIFRKMRKKVLQTSAD